MRWTNAICIFHRFASRRRLGGDGRKEGKNKERGRNRRNKNQENNTENQGNERLALWKDQQNWQISGQTERKKEKLQITNISNETRDTAGALTDVERILRPHHQHRRDDLDEMDPFHKPPQCPRYETDRLNSPVSIKEIALAI